jgi:hypothetical protein
MDKITNFGKFENEVDNLLLTYYNIDQKLKVNSFVNTPFDIKEVLRENVDTVLSHPYLQAAGLFTLYILYKYLIDDEK